MLVPVNGRALEVIFTAKTRYTTPRLTLTQCIIEVKNAHFACADGPKRREFGDNDVDLRVLVIYHTDDSFFE